jgi:hypothetical protein
VFPSVVASWLRLCYEKGTSLSWRSEMGDDAPGLGFTMSGLKRVSKAGY